MLNHVKLLQELERVADRLFPDFSSDFDCVRTVWERIARDRTFAYRVKELNVPWLVPSWQGNLDDFFPVAPLSRYQVLAVDGSQVYPDRHEGTPCSMINVGTVVLRYSVPGPSVQLATEPTVFVGDEDAQLHESPHELVNCRRQEFEFAAGVKHAKIMQQHNDASSIFLFDGSIIFWHLEAKEKEVKQHFLISYLDYLHQLYEQKMLLAGYISLTKSKEIVNLVRIAITELADELQLQQLVTPTLQTAVERMCDAQIVHLFLEPYTRTGIFKNHSSITKLYPAHLHPHFFYLHVGNEIVRIELPAWIAQQPELVTLVASMIMDQAAKGGGYPVALAESHEQAVVKGPDRELFYHLVRKVGQPYAQRGALSQKVLNKKRARI